MEKLKELILRLFKLENVLQSVTGYVETRVELFKLEIRTDVAKAISRAMALLFLSFLAFLFLLFLSIGLAFFMNSIFESQHIGFFILAVVYGVLFLVFYLTRKSIEANLERQFLKKQKNKVID
jgi:uncharacterized membrane protein YqjE